MSKVWVIMGNDYPDGVFDSKDKADAYVLKKQTEDRSKWEKENIPAKAIYYTPRIYWRHYEYEVK